MGSDQAILAGDLAMELSQRYHMPSEVPLISNSKINRYIPSIKKAKDELDLFSKFDFMNLYKK